MSRRITKRQEEQRRCVLSDLERSGQSVAAFAREHGLSPWTLYKWRSRSAEGAGRIEEPKPAFVQVTVRPTEVRPTEVLRSAIQIELDRGVRVHVPSGFDEGELRRLLGVLTSC